mmetsp:Transcript_5238/g.8622  ORF Transcript_5238/g.8622 Transcript_5238/m.8622 type:complete len:85 (+) Transcript_5238:334-588(+)
MEVLAVALLELLPCGGVLALDVALLGLELDVDVALSLSSCPSGVRPTRAGRVAIQRTAGSSALVLPSNLLLLFKLRITSCRCNR